MNKIKLANHLNIINFILWLSLLINIIFSHNTTDLKFACVASMIVVLVDIGSDILNNRDKRIRRKVILEYMENEFENDKDKHSEE